MRFANKTDSVAAATSLEKEIETKENTPNL
jgi:hypothetical protein